MTANGMLVATGLLGRRGLLVLVAWVWLTMVGIATPAFADPAPPAIPASSTLPTEPPREPARLDDGSKIALPPMTIPLDRPPTSSEADRRPMLLGAGVIVLAMMFWWNRRRRDRFEREDRGTSPQPVQPASHDTDEDADDLHAAARGEATNTQGTPDARGTEATPDAVDRPDR